VLTRIAVRNLLKNRRRSLYAILAIGLGFTAVNLFGGFTRYINSSLRDGFIYSQGQGHLTIFRKGFLEEGGTDPVRYLLRRTEEDSIRAILADQPEVLLTTPQLQISGLLTDGRNSTIFIATGHVPSELRTITSRAPGMLGRLTPFRGRALEDSLAYGVGLSSGLAHLLHLELGDGAIAMAPTVDGRINALDAEVFQTFESTVEVLNDKLMAVPLTFAHDLYDTQRNDRLTVLLEKTSQTRKTAARLKALFANRGMDLEIRTWEDLSVLYTKVRNMFDIIFLFLFVIVLVISGMSVVNTINMAVMERIREIGTFRALGMRRHRIVRLFAVESGLLGAAGSVFGALLTLTCWLAVRLAHPTWSPPIITSRLPLEIHLVPEYFALSFLFLVLLSVAAAGVPARRAVRGNIVEALGHV